MKWEDAWVTNYNLRQSFKSTPTYNLPLLKGESLDVIALNSNFRNGVKSVFWHFLHHLYFK